MKFNISEYIKEHIQKDSPLWEKYENIHQELTLPAKTTLLEVGKIPKNFYCIQKGCVRLWFNQDGKEITMQFFLEGECVASIDGFIQGTPSLFSIETIEPTTVWVYKKADILNMLEEIPTLENELYNLIMSRLKDYTHLFLSRIKDTPQQRYENLLKEHPEIIKRIPLHYIASYLGITPVSLSRIRNRK